MFDPSDELCKEHDEKLNSELGIVKLNTDLAEKDEVATPSAKEQEDVLFVNKDAPFVYLPKAISPTCDTLAYQTIH